MKAISKYLFAIALLFGIAPLAVAQNYIEKNNIATHKTVTPTPTDGKFWITLEAFTTGTVTTTTEVAPADIILVLDYSGSMDKDHGNAIEELKPAVAKFVKKIQETNGNVKADKNGKHRIALVLFSTEVFEGSTDIIYHYHRGFGGTMYVENDDYTTINASQYLNTLLDVDSFNAGTSSVSYSGTDLLNYTPIGGTNSPAAMSKAKDILSAAASRGDYSGNGSNRSRIVVFFTDGDPMVITYRKEHGYHGWLNPEEYQYIVTDTQTGETPMNNTITYADQIKTSGSYGAKIYSVGLFSEKNENTKDRVTTYMRYVSSDETGKRVPDGPQYESVTGKYSIIVDDASKLEQVFESISNDEGTTGAQIGSTSTTTVDVVSASFNLPKNANTSDIKIYTAKCKGATGATASNNWVPTLNDEGKVKEFLFDTEVLASEDDINDNVQPEIDKEKNVVSVSGFDFSKHYCAAKKDPSGNYTGEYAGYKIIIKIPIEINEKAVGGNGTATNDSGSGIFMKDKDGTIITPAAALFEHPEVNLPVNIWIEKSGLRKGESAKFKIFRAPYAHIGGETDTYQSWSAFDAAASWTPFTTVVITGVGEDESVTQKLNGLDGAYYYKIVEESWSWSYNNSLVTDDNTYMQHENPFKFSNTKRKDTIPKHAESVVTNKFGSNGQSKDVQSVDSREFFTKEAEQQEK